MGTSPGYSYSEAGLTDSRESIENDVFFQTSFIGTPITDPLGLIDSTAVDSGHTSYTGQLRAGLVMAKLTSTGAWVDYDPTANDGSQFACGILCREVYLLNPSTGANVSKTGLIAVAGNFKSAGSQLIGLDRAARSALKRQGFNFDDAPTVPVCGQSLAGPKYITIATTLTSADCGRLIISGGAGSLTHTLPAIANGLAIEIENVVDQAITVASAEGTNIVAVNNAGASSVAASTASMKIGARFRFDAVYVNGTLKWLFSNQSAGAVTVTVA